MSCKEVSSSQFRSDENKIIHVPTGAWFSYYDRGPDFEGEFEFSHENMGRAGDVLDNGDDYCLEDIRKIAKIFWRDQKYK